MNEMLELPCVWPCSTCVTHAQLCQQALLPWSAVLWQKTSPRWVRLWPLPSRVFWKRADLYQSPHTRYCLFSQNFKKVLHRKALQHYSGSKYWWLCSVTLTWGAAGRTAPIISGIPGSMSWNTIDFDHLLLGGILHVNGMNHHICISATALAQECRTSFLLSKTRTQHIPGTLSPPSSLILLLQGISSARWLVKTIIKCHARTTTPTTEGNR